MEKDVLPIFYYNDLLAQDIGDPIGLNLFEPRYREMCGRMSADPRFLFMPNYEDYQCRAGDVGFIIRVTNLTQHPGHGTFGISGVAEETVAVGCTWIEPDTSGLHFAQYWKLNQRGGPNSALPFPEMQEFYNVLRAKGWDAVRDNRWRHLLHLDGVPQDLILGANWPDRVFLMAQEAPDGFSDVIPKLLEESWSITRQALSRSAGDINLLGLVHRVPSIRDGPALDALFQSLHAELVQDCAARKLLASVPFEHLPWSAWLDEARISSVEGMGVNFASVRITPYMLRRPSSARSQQVQQERMLARVSNGTNVLFYAALESVRVTPESADRTRLALLARLNSLRLRIIHRARQAGCGPFAALSEQATAAICDFVAPGLRTA
eukprot:TRINITY_DN28074_c0_g1_i1.p1 TRINITY_DN28074_c0_g1~~TRINITY_DN28074_c0_g1_i1.p1  ORF type:complete len:425 (+),score=62.40 TRINITY_DN28074_c0_g1_i1:141-1277(+)